MNPLEISELIITICTEMTRCIDIINMGSVNKYHKKIIRENKWPHLCVQLQTNKDLLLMIQNYNFCKLDLRNTNVTDKSVSFLTNLHTLNLSNTKVSDASVSFLTNLHTLNLGNTKVTDATVSFLTNLHILNINYALVTDKCIDFLESKKVRI